MTHYADRDPRTLEPYYCAHVAAMTAEGLHAKSAIAAELAVRDQALHAANKLIAEAADEAKLLDERAQVAERERDEARQRADLLATMLQNDATLTRLHYEQGGPLVAEIKGAVLHWLAATCRDLSKEGPNYVEIHLRDDLGEMVATIQKREGKTPHELRREAEAARDAANKLIAEAADEAARLDATIQSLRTMVASAQQLRTFVHLALQFHRAGDQAALSNLLDALHRAELPGAMVLPPFMCNVCGVYAGQLSSCPACGPAQAAKHAARAMQALGEAASAGEAVPVAEATSKDAGWDSADYYECVDGTEYLSHESAEEALEHYIDGSLDPRCNVASVILAMPPILVTAYTRNTVAEGTAKRWAGYLADNLNDIWAEDEYADPDGDTADGPGDKLFRTQLEPILADALARTRVWTCTPTGTREFSGEVLLAMMRVQCPHWFAEPPPDEP